MIYRILSRLYKNINDANAHFVASFKTTESSLIISPQTCRAIFMRDLLSDCEAAAHNYARMNHDGQ